MSEQRWGHLHNASLEKWASEALSLPSKQDADDFLDWCVPSLHKAIQDYPDETKHIAGKSDDELKLICRKMLAYYAAMEQDNVLRKRCAELFGSVMAMDEAEALTMMAAAESFISQADCGCEHHSDVMQDDTPLDVDKEIADLEAKIAESRKDLSERLKGMFNERRGYE